MTAARLLAARWPLYLLVCAIVFLLQAIFHVLVHQKFADIYAELVGAPLVIVVVTVFSGMDARSTSACASTADRWGRVIERAWAIVIVDAALTLVLIDALQSMGAPDVADRILGIVVLLLSAMLVYTEPFLCLEERVDALTMVPFAFMRSMMLAWVNPARILSLLFVQIAVEAASFGVDRLAAAAGIRNAVWVDMAYLPIANALLAVLFAVAYLDTLAQERKLAR